MSYGAALLIQALAYVTLVYRHRGFKFSPDGRYYENMARGERVPPPYSRRWLVPFIARATRMRWAAISGIAWLATGPLVYDLTGELWCVWLVAWLPGFATNVRFPVLVDQVAFALMLGAASAYHHDQTIVALCLLGLSGQAKESAPFFGLALCLSWGMAAVAVVSAGVAILVGKRMGAPKDRDFMLTPMLVAMTKHDPLDYKEMVLPWGGVAVLAGAMLVTGSYSTMAACVAGASLVMGYGQLLMANDSVRLYQWAAPAVLVWMAPYHSAWMVLVLVAHPFVCGVSKRV